MGEGCSVFYPEFEFCTDNGAMIALAGALRLARGVRAAPPPRSMPARSSIGPGAGLPQHQADFVGGASLCPEGNPRRGLANL